MSFVSCVAATTTERLIPTSHLWPFVTPLELRGGDITSTDISDFRDSSGTFRLAKFGVGAWSSRRRRGEEANESGGSLAGQLSYRPVHHRSVSERDSTYHITLPLGRQKRIRTCLVNQIQTVKLSVRLLRRMLPWCRFYKTLGLHIRNCSKDLEWTLALNKQEFLSVPVQWLLSTCKLSQVPPLPTHSFITGCSSGLCLSLARAVPALSQHIFTATSPQHGLFPRFSQGDNVPISI